MARNKAKQSVNLEDQKEEQKPEDQKEEPESVKAVEPTNEKKKTGKSKLMVCSTIKEDGKILEAGSVYKGNNADELLKAGALKEG